MSGDTFPGFPVGERRLAAIMFTDVTGYSARTQRDEIGTLDLVEADLKRMGEMCQQNGGEVLTKMGDGMLICFSSTVRAVTCALQIQAEFAARKESTPADQCLEHRIGIHLGDVFVRDGNVAGDGVNIAARLQTKAPPGGICISQTVHDTVKGKLAMHSVFIGPQSFKNIADPIPVYHLSPDGVPGTAPPFRPLVPPTPPVLPERGIFRGKPGGGRTLSGLGWGLLAAALVASLLLVGGAARRKRQAAAVPAPEVAAVKPTPVPTPPPPARAVATAPSPVIAEARSFFEAPDARPADFLVAEGILKRSVAADPGDAAALAAYSELDSAFYRQRIERTVDRQEGAHAMADQALKLAPDSVEALVALGRAERIKIGGLGGAEQAFRLALNKQPANAAVMADLAETQRAEGNLAGALDLYARALKGGADPAAIQCEQARTLFYLRRFKDADDLAAKSFAARAGKAAAALRALIELSWHANGAVAGRILAQVPASPTVGEDEMIFLRAYAALLDRHAADALTALKAFPGTFFAGPVYFGPKGYLTGLAHQRLGETAQAQADWEMALAEVRKRLGIAPKAAPLHEAAGRLLASLLRAVEAGLEARSAVVRQPADALTGAWIEDPAVIFGLLGRDLETSARLEHLLAAKSTWPLTPELLRADPIWDALRDKPRFKRLLPPKAAGS